MSSTSQIQPQLPLLLFDFRCLLINQTIYYASPTKREIDNPVLFHKMEQISHVQTFIDVDRRNIVRLGVVGADARESGHLGEYQFPPHIPYGYVELGSRQQLQPRERLVLAYTVSFFEALIQSMIVCYPKIRTICNNRVNHAC